MKNRSDYDSALAAEYVLGTLRGAARLKFERRLQQEPELALEVSRWQNALAHLDDSLTPVTPPAHIWKKIALSLPAIQPARAKPHGWHYSGWALAASLAGILLYSNLRTETAPTDQPVAILNSADNAKGQWIVNINPARTELSLTALNPPALDSKQSLQLWLIPADGIPRSLGLIQARQLNRVDISHHQLANRLTLAISLEPQGGSPTGQPTGPVLFNGQLSQL
ncbi:anti-sigma-K factor RskA [Erwinia toletana]|uniref:Regulator of SigK n=1 Tax=Winslowiella toletana TaxID=92490 RepID=A0ABS4PAW7_9GAMM|nr:anti-sigma factor [Winslowiella toletana]MBP2169793.1 anti-sigma-K factor RskA [Winslowiella toletana]